MANITHKRTVTEKVTIKGLLSDDGSTITVVEKDFEREVLVQDYLNKFAGEYCELTLQTKSEDDLTDEDVQE